MLEGNFSSKCALLLGGPHAQKGWVTILHLGVAQGGHDLHIWQPRGGYDLQQGGYDLQQGGTICTYGNPGIRQARPT